MMRIALLFLLLLPACVHTSLHSPRALAPDESTVGVHTVGVVSDGNAVGGVFVGTFRKGFDFGELGVNVGNLGTEASLKHAFTEPSDQTHLSIIAGAGLWAFVLPEVSIGLLAGQDLGPLTVYGGYRQYAVTSVRVGDEETGSLGMSNAIAGAEIRLSPNVSLMTELNYNFIALGDAGDDDDLIFNAPLISLGLNFGRTRTPVAPPAPVPVPAAVTY